MAKKRAAKKSASTELRDRIVELRRVRAGDLQPNPENWRTHGDDQMAALSGILGEVGIADAVLAFPADGLGPDGDLSKLMLFDGHARTERDPEQLWPVIVTDLTLDEARKMLAVTDPLAAMAGAHEARLNELLANVSTDNEALLAMLDGLRGTEPAKPIVEDDVPEPPVDPITKPGDLWLLGEHRLLCGDSTRSEDVERVMAGAKADILMTDPPYNVDYTGGTNGALKVANDNMADGDFRQFLNDCFRAAFDAMKPGAAFYIFHADLEGYNFRRAVKDCGQHVRQCLIWVKNTLVLGRQDYQSKHEPCLYGWKEGASHGWYSDRKQTTLLHFDRPSRRAEHPTMKPVMMIAYLVGNSTAPQGLVLDTFLGSGTTLIAAEQLGRRCYGMEISPAYCDVIVKRWENLTGKKAVREQTSDG